MTKKYFKLLLSLGVILCILCTSFTMSLAAPQWGEFEGEVEEDFFDDDESTTLEVEEDTTEETTRKETKPATTQAQVKPTASANTAEKTTQSTKETTRKNNEKTTKAETTAPSETNTETTDEDEALLKDGQFFVYLERNNGERRLKTILNKPGLVPQPNTPIRVGYIFKGWYKDAKFTEPWDFGKSIAEKGTVIYAKWEAAADTVEYKITVEKTKDGIISVNPGTASAGEVVIITVKPNAGKRLVAGSITINGKHSEVLSFIMPEGDVVVGASFEDAPEIEQPKEKDILPIIVIAAAALVVIALVVVVIIVKYKNRPAIVEYDENGAIILDDDDDDHWIDDSIVIEDGFSNGRIIHESIDADGFETEGSDPFETK